MSRDQSRADCQPHVASDQIEWHAADMTATMGAAVRWMDLDQNNGLWLPIDCQGRPDAAVGDLLSQNSTGPLRLGFGGWRDLLLGCQFINGRGELITVGGRTVKNVAGYDLTKFMAGQNGVFGRMVSLTTRLHRRPESALLASFAPEMEIFNRLLPSPCRPQWAALTREHLTCGYLASSATIDYYARQLPAWQPRQITRRDLAEDSRWRTEHWALPGGSGLGTRATVPPMRIMEFVKRCRLDQWVADPAFGVVLTNTAADATIVGGRSWSWGAEGLASYSAGASERGILQRLKKAMDPDNGLAPLPAS